jgi:sulfur carrier protein
MNIIINGEPKTVPNDFTAAQLIDHLGLQGKRLAMEVNLEIVPRSMYTTHRFAEGDKIEVVHAIGGG